MRTFEESLTKLEEASSSSSGWRNHCLNYSRRATVAEIFELQYGHQKTHSDCDPRSSLRRVPCHSNRSTDRNLREHYRGRNDCSRHRNLARTSLWYCRRLYRNDGRLPFSMESNKVRRARLSSRSPQRNASQPSSTREKDRGHDHISDHNGALHHQPVHKHLRRKCTTQSSHPIPMDAPRSPDRTSLTSHKESRD